jgi:ParB family chromosome partitioning protein
MMQNRRPLGRGLDALIPSSAENVAPPILPTELTKAHAGDRVKTVPIDQIVPNRMQPRKTFDEEKIRELSASIKEQGIIQPLIVVQASPNRFELVAGERRLRASKMAGLTEVPVIVKNVDTEGMLELSIIENIQREDLNPIEEANAICELIDQFNYTQEEVATRLSKSRTAVANSLRLLNLPKVIQDDVSANRLSAGHARALLAVNNLQDQLKLRERIINSNLNVRDIEKMIQNLRPFAARASRKPAVQLSPQMKFILDEITKKLATKVRIEPDKEKKGGRVVIDYYAPQDLDRIYKQIVK